MADVMRRYIVISIRISGVEPVTQYSIESSDAEQKH